MTKKEHKPCIADPRPIPSILPFHGIVAYFTHALQTGHNGLFGAALPVEKRNATIVAVEYSDGFGRQLQTRTQAEDLLFGNAELGDSGLPADQDVANAPAVGTLGTDNVVVSGAKLYNNKGKVVEQWEPYFSTGFDLTDVDVQHGQKVRIYYDALGRPQRTVNPDGTEQRVVYGVPNSLNTPGSFKSSPWERYTYDALDLAPLTHPATPSAPSDFTPKSEVVDALGRTVKTTEHLAHFNGTTYEDVVMQYEYDIKGQLLKVIDPLGRDCFLHKYDTAGNNLWTEHLDSGVKTLAVDAQGKPLYSTDEKGAEVYTAYDDLHRPTDIWAKDAGGESVTLRQHIVYGDSAGLIDPHLLNLNGKLVAHYDEAGKASISGYDFKGNPLEKTRQVVADTELTGTSKYTIDWTGLAVALESKEYVTTLLYDGINRVRKSILPEDVDTARKELIPTYNRAGALEAMTFNNTEYVRQIAYNAKGQRVLLAMGNDMMTRYAYDPVIYRLLRIKTEKYVEASDTYTPQSGSTKQDTAYEYDLGGNILKLKERVTDCGIASAPLGADALNRTFQYDPLKRLLQATGRESNTQSNADHWIDKPVVGDPNATHTRAYTQNFQYDKVGNILDLVHAATGNGYTRNYNYVSGINHLASIDNGQPTPIVNASFTYDANGNQLTVNTDRYFEWDAADQLAYFKREASGSITSEAHYIYAGGNRVKKFVRDQNGNTTITVYIDGVYEHRYKKDATQAVTAEQTVLNIMDGRSRIATTHLGDLFGDFVDALKPTHYNLEDHLGTSAARLDSNGTVLDRTEYYPFGDTSMSTSNARRYRYVGKELDSESGLYYYGARYYAAWTCRFISVDPLASKYPQLSSYNYAANDPIGDFDIDGRQNNKTEPAGGSNMPPPSTDAELDAGLGKPVFTNDLNPEGLRILKHNPTVTATKPSLPANKTSTPEAVQPADGNPKPSVAASSPSYQNPPQTPPQAPLKAESAFQADARKLISAIADKGNEESGGKWAKPAGDIQVTAYQLFYQWVHGTGTSERHFKEGSWMGEMMLGTEYVQGAMHDVASKALKGNLSSKFFARSLRDEPIDKQLEYPLDLGIDVLFANPARGLHGSISGTVTANEVYTDPLSGQSWVFMTVKMRDDLSAISGTRAAPILKGYNGNSIFTENNPYGPEGQFRTIMVYYNLNVAFRLQDLEPKR